MTTADLPTTSLIRRLRLHALAALLLGLLCFIAFSPALDGDFIYDDARQILDNPLVLEPGREWEALTSGVWAFTDPSEQILANYWRPVFTGWTIVNARLFDVDDTTRWHIANIALHVIATLLAYALLVRLGLHRAIAFAGGALFAVHPTRVESVAWVSGSPDPLLAIGILGSLCCIVGLARNPKSVPLWIGAVLLYLFAQGAKEAAIVHFGLVAATVWAAAPGEMACGAKLRRAALLAAPFVALGVVYFIVRAQVLGSVAERLDEAPGLTEMLLTTPAIGAFYLKQAFAPMLLGPSYPLRAVTTDAMSAANFYIPLAIVLLAGVAMLLLAWRRPLAVVGLALFALLLAPSLNIGVFLSERIVQDRYLYLPLLGLVLMVIEAARWAFKMARSTSPLPPVMIAGFLGVLAIVCTIATRSYAPVWTSEKALWTRAVRTDPTSAMNRALLGAALMREGDVAGAKKALDEALAIGPVTSALLDRAEIAIGEQRPADAEPDLRRVLANFPDNPRAWEFLGTSLAQQGRLDEAIEALRQGREQTQGYTAAFTGKIAVYLYYAGRKNEVLAELEAARAQADVEGTSPAALVYFHLGNLYVELDRTTDARAAFERYLELSVPFNDPQTVSSREHATSELRRLPR